MKATEILKKYFGYESFREGQQELIDNILKHRDVLGIMPTGGREIHLLSGTRGYAGGDYPGHFASDFPDEGSGGNIESGRYPSCLSE